MCVDLAMKYPSFHYVDFSTWCLTVTKQLIIVYCSDKALPEWILPSPVGCDIRLGSHFGLMLWRLVDTQNKTRLCNPCLLSITLQINIRVLSSMKGQVHLWSKDNFIIRLELFVKCIVRGKPQASLSDRTAMLTEIVLSEEELMVFWMLGNDQWTNNPRHISLEWPSLEPNLLLAWTLLSVLHCFAVVCCSKCLCLVR